MTQDVQPITLLYLDEVLAVIHKPAGIAVHQYEYAGASHPTCMHWVRKNLGRTVHPVHRLDSATSGVLLFACNKEILSQLQRQFVAGQVEKRYRAVMRGWFKEAMLCEKPLKRTLSVAAGMDEFQDAWSNFIPTHHLEMPWPTKSFPQSRYTMAEVVIKTGRYHQIRRHAHSLSHPIVGDTKHGDGLHNKIWRSNRNCHRLLLHATSIRLIHPVYDAAMEWSAPLPDDFIEATIGLPWIGIRC